MTSISIDRISTERSDSTPRLRRLVFEVTTSNGTGDMWFDVEDEFADFIVDDRCDPAIVAMLSLAVREGYTSIESSIPISKSLYDNLVDHVIPQLCIAEGAQSRSLTLNLPVAEATFSGSAVGTGMSLGVDSFSTLYEYGKNSLASADKRVTHLTYFDVGAHHGFDVRLGQSKVSRRDLYEGQLDRAREFADEFGYKLVVIGSNLRTFLAEFLGRSQFYATHTYRNVAAAMVLQKMFHRYYYSATYNLDKFNLSLNIDSAYYEKWLLPHLQTGSMEFLSANRAWSRLEKTTRVAMLPESYKYLTVCFVGVRNCGECAKCERTLLALDVLGKDVLDNFGETFDLQRYRGETRERLLQDIYSGMRRKGTYGTEMKEIFDYALAHRPEIVPEPTLDENYSEGTFARVDHGNVRLRRLPYSAAPVGEKVSRDSLFPALGKFGSWIKISSGLDVGFVRGSTVEVVEPTERGSQRTAVVSLAEGSIGRAKSGTKVIAHPTTNAETIFVARDDEPFTILGTSGAWMRVSARDTDGYVLRDVLRIVEPVASERGSRAVLTEQAHLRSLPTRHSTSRAVLAKTNATRVVHRVGTWYFVETTGGERGYLRKQSIRVQPTLAARVRRRVARLSSRIRR